MEKEYFTIKLGENINSNNANDVYAYLQSEIDNNKGKIPVFDANNLEYISSSGLRIFLKIQKSFEEKLQIKNVSLEVYEIFDVTGFTQILSIEKKMRSISVDGCKIIGKGYYGTVYRLDNDTVVKVYSIKDSIPMIKNEQSKAKIAFVSGIPTAISYDIVKVGEYYGSVFELLNAKTLNEILIENPNDSDAIIEKYVNFIKEIHNTELKTGDLPQAKEIYLKYLEAIKYILPQDQYKKLYSLLCAVPEDNHIVHGDIHMKNIMLANGELTLIDMDTLSKGQDIFDNCDIYLAYMQYKEDDPDNPLKFFGITEEMSEHIWNKFIELYYAPKTKEEYERIFSTIYVLSSIQFLYLIETSDDKDDELNIQRKSHTLSNLSKYLPNINSFLI